MIINFLKYLSKLNRFRKRLVQMTFDSFLFCFSLIIAVLITELNYSSIISLKFLLISLISMSTSLFVLFLSGFYNNIIRHASIEILYSSLPGLFFSLFIVISLAYITKANFSIMTFFLFFLLFLTSLLQSRIIIRYFYKSLSRTNKINVAIYGAGDTGRHLAITLKNTEKYSVEMFLDDDIEIQNYYVNGIKVYSFQKAKTLFKKKNIKLLLISMPNITPKAKRNIFLQLEHFAIQIKIIPTFQEIIENKINIDNFRSITIEELLQREQIQPKFDLMSKNVFGKNILITGAGGSIGSEICRQIIELNPKKILLLDNSEASLFKIHQEIIQKIDSRIIVVPIICSIQNKIKLSKNLEKQKIDIIFHAAAYKHVPLLEQNPFEAIDNNILGTENLVKFSIENKVNKFVLISSDKAVRPTNIMGATKRFSEMICLTENNNQIETNFYVVRFGNVIGSSGSVIPIFHNQIKNRTPITVTHKKITRYFMSIPEAAQLVIQASSMPKNKDLLILDMGKPIQIIDLAKRMAHLNGLVPYIKDESQVNGDIEIKITGLRPGEKLYEELLINHTSVPTQHPRIFSETGVKIDKEKLRTSLEKLKSACNKQNITDVIRIFKNSDIGFDHNPQNQTKFK